MKDIKAPFHFEATAKLIETIINADPNAVNITLSRFNKSEFIYSSLLIGFTPTTRNTIRNTGQKIIVATLDLITIFSSNNIDVDLHSKFVFSKK